MLRYGQALSPAAHTCCPPLPPSPPALPSHTQYKYQLNVDGTVAAYRFPYLLAGDSLVLKQDSPFYEHFYNKLEPWKHYVPLKRDLSDVVEKVQWARDHDEEVGTSEGGVGGGGLLTLFSIVCMCLLCSS